MKNIFHVILKIRKSTLCNKKSKVESTIKYFILEKKIKVQIGIGTGVFSSCLNVFPKVGVGNFCIMMLLTFLHKKMLNPSITLSTQVFGPMVNVRGN